MGTPKIDTINLHYRLYQNMKERALAFEGKSSAELKSYRNDLEYYSSRSYSAASENDLLNSIINSQVIFLGDFHTFDQSGRNLQRIIKSLARNRKKFTLGLEMVHHHQQEHINSFMLDEISELEFLERIQYQESWRFPWGHYKKIFELAKREQIPILGLNSEGTLKERDAFAAELISQHCLDCSSAPMLVLFGELHVLPNKLPLQILVRHLGKPLRQTIIHQNWDNVYWSMRRQGMNGQIVRFNKNEFCIISAPPWMKYESMAHWYDNICDDPDFDIHEMILNENKKTFSSNSSEHFIELLHELTQNMELDSLEPEELENFNLYDHNNIDFIENNIQKIKAPAVFNFYDYLLTSNQSFKLPKTNGLFIANYSITVLAYMAGIQIFHTYRKQFKFRNLENRDNTERFLYFTLERLFAYFCSKLINPNRKCNLYSDFERRLKEKHIASHIKRSTTFSIEILDQKKSLAKIFKGASLKHVFESSKMIGHMLADYLFDRFEKIGRDKVLHILKEILDTPHMDEKLFQKIKNLALKNIDYQDAHKEMF